MENSDKLLESMEKCGHFLYHRRGGRRGQNKILKILCDKESMTQKELQKILDIQSGSLSEIVIKLENKGLIERKKKEDDKRNIILNITEEGRNVYAEYQKIKKQQDRVLFNVLSDKEKKELFGILDKLLEDWNAKGEHND